MFSPQRALALSPQQRQEIVQLRRLFLSKMNAIMQQRREINQSLAVCGNAIRPNSQRLLPTCSVSCRIVPPVAAVRMRLRGTDLSTTPCSSEMCCCIHLQYAMPTPSFSRATAIQQLRTHESIERLRLNLKV